MITDPRVESLSNQPSQLSDLGNMEQYKLYKGKVILNFDPKKHIYRVNDKIVYGVTSITNTISKPSLVNWATKLTVDKIRENKDYLEDHLEEVLALAKKEHWEVSKRAMALGTRVHAVADRWFKEDKLGLIEEMLKVENNEERKSLSAFISLIKNHDIKREFGERKIYSKKYNYAGTADFVGTIDGSKRIVADYKTSKAIYPSYFLQTSAYAQALEEEGFKIDGTVVIRLGKDGVLEIKRDDNWKEKLPVFLALKKVYSWQMDLIAQNMDNVEPKEVKTNNKKTK